MTKFNRTLSLAFAFALFVFSGFASAGDMVPLKGRWELDRGVFSGHLTHFGTWDQYYQPPLVWEAANGDKLHITYAPWDDEIISPGIVKYTQKFTITGGTGRFKNATGGGTIYGIRNYIEDYWYGTVDGMMSRPNSGKK